MSGRRGSRMRRVNETLREVVADEITRLKDPGLGFITITAVDTSPDLRASRVFWTVYGDEAQRKETAAALERARPRIRRVAGEQIRLKYLPELIFQFDDAIEKGNRMERLLHELNEEAFDDGSEE